MVVPVCSWGGGRSCFSNVFGYGNSSGVLQSLFFLLLSHFAASAVPPLCSLHTQPCPSPTLHSWLPHCPASPGPCPAVCHRWNILQLVKKTHGIWSELPKSS